MDPRGDLPPAFPLVFFTVLTLLMLMLRRQVGRWSRNDAAPQAASERPAQGSEPLPTEEVDRLDRSLPLAVLLVGGENGLGPHVLSALRNTYRGNYAQVLFVSVGVLDGRVLGLDRDGGPDHRGSEEARRHKTLTRVGLDPYLSVAHDLGLRADCRVSIAANPAEELASLATRIVGAYPRSIFFVGKLVFDPPRWFHRILHSGTSDVLRSRLERKGIPVTVIPVVLRG